MKIVIVGAGFTGTQLARRLISEKNDVVLIDNDEDTVRHASNQLDCSVLQADGNNLATLEDAGIAKADALVCVMESDEVNMITCSLVDAVYPDLLKIARVRNYAYYVNTASAAKSHAETFAGNHRPLYGIDYMIHPDVEAAEAIIRAVESGAVSEMLSFENSDYVLTRMTVAAGSQVAGQQMMNIRRLLDRPFLVAYIEDGGRTSLPSGSTVLNAGCSIGLLSRREDVAALMMLCGSPIRQLRKIALVGAGQIGTRVAERLMHPEGRTFLSKLLGIRQKLMQEFLIIEKDEALAKAASEKFASARVCRADITDDAFIEEEDLPSYDLVICATSNFDQNMVMAAYLESLGVRQTVSLVTSAAYGNIARKLGVDVPVPLRDSIVDSIMSHLRGKTVKEIHTVNTGSLEVVECVLPADSPVAGKQLRQISDPGVFLVMLVQSGGTGSYLLPGGDTQLAAGDHIVLISASAESRRVLRKFGGAA